MDEGLMTIDDYLEIVKRRKWNLILPAVVVFVLSALVALLLPSVYKSTATILIEEQEIPADFVKAAVTSYAEQRMQSINQRIMSSNRLLEIINRFNLYQDLRDKWTTDEIVSKMRQDVKLETINAEVMDRHSGRPAEATIAFSLSYEGKESPEKIQQVANILTSLFLEENLRVRVQQTQETSKFLEEEMNKVKAALGGLDARIAAFKEKNINTLPEMLQVNIQGLDNIERRIETLQEQLRSQKEREGYLESQLANVSPGSEDQQRLDALKVELVKLKARFSDEYPDVIKTKAEIERLEQQPANAKTDLQGKGKLPENPAYITLASQLSSTRAEIVSIQKQIEGLQKNEDKYRQQIETTPKVEETYRALMTERNNTQAKYDELMQKVMEARVSQGLEKEQKGERFTLIDPARLPEKPFKPNRLAIMLIGMVLGVGAGVGLAALGEFSDTSVRSSLQLVKSTSFPVLAAIPPIITTTDLTRLRHKKMFLAASFGVAAVVGLIVFHFQVMDLSIFWAKIIRRLAI
jgi:polysaccharide chain length determinant protein (PEP-CTERM system associated)